MGKIYSLNISYLAGTIWQRTPTTVAATSPAFSGARRPPVSVPTTGRYRIFLYRAIYLILSWDGQDLVFAPEWDRCRITCQRLISCRVFTFLILNKTVFKWNMKPDIYWVPQKLPQKYIVIAYICIGKVAWFAVYICGNIWNM